MKSKINVIVISKKIFRSVDLSRYYWEIVSDQVLYEVGENNEQGLFNSCVIEELERKGFSEPNMSKRAHVGAYDSKVLINGKSIVNAIERDNYYFIFLDLKGYSSKESWGSIETYEDFVDSYCELIFMCTDSSFIEIYCKDELILQTIYNNCKKNNFDNIRYIQDFDAKGRSVIAF